SMRVGDYETNLLSPEEREGRERRGGTLWQRIVANEPGAVTEVSEGEHRRKDGTTFPVEVRVGGVVYAGERMILASSRDVAERKALEERLEHQAFHDPLTGLPNRALFQDRLEHALARAGRDDGAVAVLFLDLDDFKVVNDSLGHEAGDKLLVEVAGRLRGCLRPGDTAARLGGDEFAVLLEGAAGEGEALRVADRIGDALKTPVPLGARGSHEARANASVGVALGRSGQRAGDLLRDADVAMYGAKARGKARHELFDPAMNERATSRLEAENGLRRAIGRGEIVPFFQPKVSLASGEVVGMEALARWEDPERGLVLPAEFIGLAEETGLIVPMGEAVLREACRRAAAWRDERPSAEPVAVWVNLSPRQFHGADVVGRVSSVLEETGLEARCLGLEITEGVAMDDAESTIETLGRLKGLGVRLAIDDFGKGFSSLNYVKRFPVDCLKIDRSFVSGICERPEDLAIAQAVITLGHSLGMEVVAEGVETAEQLDLLRGLGCDHAQGYHLARPMSAEESSAFLAERADLG
nr:EAL domain-containing protein [Actinomycetota bacterium]